MTEKIASLTVERLTLPLAEHPQNPRVHPKPGTKDWELLRVSLRDAYFDPMVWNKRNGKLVSGHLRQKVMLSEGFTGADCVVVDWEENVHLARMISANRGMGEDDSKAMRKILDELSKSQGEFDLRLTGLSETALESIAFDQEKEQAKADESVAVSAPASQVRMVQLFLTVETFPKFMVAAKQLQTKLGTENLTDAIYKLVTDAYSPTA